jgi:antitoxin (DNA-binding transcriptional repressor) of toxin-antitoxin stability system
MERVSILQFRRDAESVIRKVRQGKRFILTYRGQAVMRLEPIRQPRIGPDDPFYALPRLAVSDKRSLTNEEIDQIVYET